MDVQALKIDRSSGSGAPKQRARRRGGSPWLLRGVVIAVLVAVGFALRVPILAALDRLNLPRVALYRVTTSRPAEAGAVQGTAANGYVVAARRAALSADTPGRIDELRVVEGSVVQRGEVVARLFQDEFRASLAGAEAALMTARASVRAGEASLATSRAVVQQRKADLEAARSDVADCEAQLELATARRDRVLDLVASQIASQDELDAAVATCTSADAQRRVAVARLGAAQTAVAAAEAGVVEAAAQVEVAEARIAEAEASRDLAAATLDKTEVRAPFDGVVVLKDAEVGEVVSPNSQGGSNARGSVCTLVDFDSLEVQADVPESSLQAVRIGGRVQVFLDAFPERAYGGRVDRIWPTADRQKATVEVRAKFDERDDLLRPDMGVRVVFLPEDAAEPASAGTDGAAGGAVLLLPESAVVRDGGQTAVFVYERGTVRLRAVRTGARDGRRVVVEEGLEPGEQVVLEPPPSLADGARVQLAETSGS